MEFAGFDWDQGNLAKCLKHDLSLETIESLFRSGLRILPDAAHSRTEPRFRAVGRTQAGQFSWFSRCAHMVTRR